MDLTILIFIALFAVASFLLFVVYKFGIKEKSYEEALAEQRQQTNILLGTKSKPKEKKSKKANKKPKEKPVQENDVNESENTENKENAHPSKLHVEFKEETEEVIITEELKLASSKESNKQKKVKKVRPILVKKEQSPQRIALEVVEAPIANHFEEIQPKDDFELLRSNSRDDIFKQEPVKEKVVKEKKQTTEVGVTAKNKKNAKTQQTEVGKQEKPAPPPEEKVEEKVIIEVIPAVPQTNGIVANTGKEKKKKKSEFNTKQQLSAERDGLINSVRKAELSKTEIQYLIDLLLNKQLEAPAVIDDWSEGKSDPVQKLKRQLAEKEKALVDEQQALVGAQAKLREIRSEQQAEKSQLQQKLRLLEESMQNKQIEIQAAANRYQVAAQKMQQIQNELSAEMMKTRKLMDDNNALQMQVQQYEVSIPQVQESEGIIMKLRTELNDAANSNQQLQQLAVDKDHQNQNLLMQIATLKDSMHDAQKKLEIYIRKENDWTREMSSLNTSQQKQFEEQRNLEHTVSQLNGLLHNANSEKAEATKIIAQLKADLQKTKEELNGLGDIPDSKNKHEVEILNLSNELSSTRNELSSKIEELQQNERKYKTELETSNKKYQLIQKELEEQKTKNNQLSSEIISKEQDSQKQFMQRLFPDIEALKTLNSSDWQDQCAKLIEKYVRSLKEEQQHSSQHSSPQKSSEVIKLQAQIEHYKNTIDDTEGLLNELQKRVEQEEMTWRGQLAAKEAELENLKASHLSQLQSKLVNLENLLSKEVEEKKKLLEECQLLKSQKTQCSTQADSTATIEKLSEEVNHLREQLRLEQTKNGDVGVCIKAQNCNNSSNGPSFLDHCLSSSSSVASSLIEDYKKPKNKKRKKKVSNVRNANICSNMGCQFLYCDGNSCGNNL
ncbi:ribosome-binding protein 1-like isoform X9 [Diabrotica virgifera virgifera]|uniref:Ribosome-binding protein 1 n=1 Tax=Diabrotica virgifera virgifera TaxID=50390 RepID=A0ABM5K5V7_DIAVI|nr:ribosome-binding protein 1-like isoform X9 [Diabrotica virgifera virgifera]